MIQQLLPILGVGVAAIIIAWLLIGRLVRQPSWLRTVLRLGASVAVIGLAVLLMPRPGTAAQPVPASVQNITQTETTVVEQGSLTISLNATGSLSPVQQLELAFELSDPVIEMLVTEGQRVEAGDALARLDPTDAEAAVRDAEIALAQAQADYDDLTQPPRDVDIAVAEAQVSLAQASLYAASLGAPDATDEEIARLNLEVAQNQLWQSQLNRDITQALNPEFRNGNGGANAQDIQQNSRVESQEYNVQIEQADYQSTLSEGADAGALSGANASLVQAQANLDDLLNPASDAELRRAEIDLETARLGLERAQQQLAQTTLTAPIAGLIADEDLTVGQVPPSSDVMTLVDDSSYTIELAIDETDVVDVQVGQRAELSVDALPGAEITGIVSKVASAPSIEGQLVTYTVTVTLDLTTAPLRPAMSATATIMTSELENVIVVPNRFIRVDSETQRTFVTVEENGQFREVAVVIGARNAAESEIVSGLQAGQTIALPLSETQTQAGGVFGGPPAGGGQDAGGPGGN
jgi:HlyD family secretion protein